jgi:hypothetical protein
MVECHCCCRTLRALELHVPEAFAVLSGLVPRYGDAKEDAATLEGRGKHWHHSGSKTGAEGVDCTAGWRPGEVFVVGAVGQ